jgi:hypothetical protein
MSFGHYWSLSRTTGPNPKWIEYDDQKIRVVQDREVGLYYGSLNDGQGLSGSHSAYMLLYEGDNLMQYFQNDSDLINKYI